MASSTLEGLGTLGICIDPVDATLGSSPDIAYIDNSADTPLWSTDGVDITGASQRPHLSGDYMEVSSGQKLYLATTADGTSGPANSPFKTPGNYPLTIGALVKPSALGDSLIIGGGSSSAGFFSTYTTGLMITSSGKARVTAINAGTGAQAEGGKIVADEWAVIVGVVAASATYLYVNGVQVASDLSGTINPTTTYHWGTIGASDGSGSGANQYQFTGLIGKVVVYSGALSSSDVRTLSATIGNAATRWRTSTAPMVMG